MLFISNSVQVDRCFVVLIRFGFRSECINEGMPVGRALPMDKEEEEKLGFRISFVE